MKKAFSAIELLLILVIFAVIFLLFRGINPVSSIVKERKEINTQREQIYNQIDEIQRLKDVRNESIKQVIESE